MEELFGALRDASVSLKARSSSNEQGSFEQDDVLQIDKNDDEVDTESKFQEIEANLKKLPKLENGFDALAKKKTKKGKLPSIEMEEGTTKKSKKDDSDWFALPKPDDNMRREVQRDLLLINIEPLWTQRGTIRSSVGRSQERFAIGTIVEDKSEFYSSHMNRKDRKSTILETLMGDDTSNKYFKL